MPLEDMDYHWALSPPVAASDDEMRQGASVRLHLAALPLTDPLLPALDGGRVVTLASSAETGSRRASMDVTGIDLQKSYGQRTRTRAQSSGAAALGAVDPAIGVPLPERDHHGRISPPTASGARRTRQSPHPSPFSGRGSDDLCGAAWLICGRGRRGEQCRSRSPTRGQRQSAPGGPRGMR